MTVWVLWSINSGAFDPPELLAAFADRETAETTKAHLIGKRRCRMVRNWVWEDDEDLPDLVVRPLDIH